MSRTTRHIPQPYFIFRGMRIMHADVDRHNRTINGNRELYEEYIAELNSGLYPKSKMDYEVVGRDDKPWDKPNKKFKQMYRQMERAKAKQAVSQDKEPEIVKKSDKWNWT
jgi:hypothetical protein